MKEKITKEDYLILTKDKIRYADTDRQGHVNNSVFNQFFETGRVEIIYNPTKPLHDLNCSFVIAKLNVQFFNELIWPGEVEIGTKVLKIGSSSFDLEQALFQKGECVALGETTIVQVNNSTKKSQPLSDQSKFFLSSLSQ
jgi:acyl-CoA thioester hydrolase